MPWGLIGFLLLGFAAGVLNVVRGGRAECGARRGADVCFAGREECGTGEPR